MKEPRLKHFWDQLDNSKLVYYLLLFALGWAIVQVLVYFDSVIVIFTFSAILAFLLNYPVRWLSRYMPRGVAVIVIFLIALLAVTGLVATLGFALLAQAQQLAEQSPRLLEFGFDLLNNLQRSFQRWNISVDLTTIEEQIRDQLVTGIAVGLATLQNVLGNLLNLIFISVIAFFMLLDGNRLWRFLLKLVDEDQRDRVTSAIQQNFLGFFWGRLLLSIFFGVSSFLVFVILQVPYALLLAVIAGVFDLIPGIGATLGISLVAIILLPQGFWTSLKVIGICIGLQQIEENLLMPRIMQGSINMNPVVMFFALLVGARVAGLVGVFLSIPIAGVVISLLQLNEMKAKEEPPPEEV
ncbi:AI-2E family transporter [Leptolyngbya sp. AN02str]|uniref:AI-2E family transporter n=1 Tax=Leptolyngbya sp. AN02str TaxID=3423363 RepID=UPI003D31096B